MAELVLRPSRKKWLLVMVACAAFVGGGAAMIVWPVALRTGDSRFVAVLATGFFGLVFVVSAVQVVPGSGYLRCTADGFELRSLFVSRYRAWSSIDHFEVWTNPAAVMARSVGWVDAPGYKGRRTRLRSYSLFGVDGILPDTYGHRAEDLAALMNDRLDASVRRGARLGPGS